LKQSIKKEVRIVGFEDGGFNFKSVIGVVFRGGLWLEGLIKFDVKSNSNVTEELLKALKNSPHFKQLRVIMLSKDALAGKKINLQKIHEDTKIPVITAYKSGRLNNKKNVFLMKIKGRKVYFNAVGLSKELAKKVLENSLRNGFPEPLRIAFLMAKAFNSFKHTHEKI
jgi:endonuclease V-like protein UPF0215 family